jgi:hypothetical protein
MAVGLRIASSEHGFVQLDETYRNYVLVSKTALPADASTSTNGTTAALPGLTGSSLVAFSGPGRVFPLSYNPGSGTGNIYKTAGACTAYVFDLVPNAAPPAGSGDVGFQVRNPQTNDLVFDSRWPVMRVMSTYALSKDVTHGDAGAVKYALHSQPTGGRTYAVVHGARWQSMVSRGTGTYPFGSHPIDVFAGYTYYDASTDRMVVNPAVWSFYSGNPNTRISCAGYYMVVDVTSY